MPSFALILVLVLSETTLARQSRWSPWLRRPGLVVDLKSQTKNLKLKTENSSPVLALLIWFCGSISWATAAHAVDFHRDVAPILEGYCIHCHSGDEAGGDVRLDRWSDAVDSLGIDDPDNSPLLDAVRGPEPSMPKGGEPLSDRQVAILAEWIAGGASWPDSVVLHDRPPRDLDWWSLQPLPDTADVLLSDLPADRHPVDALLDRQLTQRGLQPVPPADPTVLLRRLAYDLTGLPPSETQWQSWLGMPYETVVDQLLASPEFGEKWAQHWLDVARYAETHGYDKDKPRGNAWPYRDYVIAAWNQDKPYSHFVQEQIAGDAFADRGADGILGLGFLAAGPWDFIGHVEVGEGKADGRLAKHLDRDEMIAAVFNVFTSTTVQCAQCHHHKFDPITTDDYYRLHAVFAAVDRADRPYPGNDPEQQRLHDSWQQERGRLLAQRQQLQDHWAQQLDRRGGHLLAEIQERLASRPQQADAFGWHSQISATPDETKWVQIAWAEPRQLAALQVIPAFDEYGGIGAGFGWPSRLRVEVAADADFQVDVRTVWDTTDRDEANPGKRDLEIPLDVSPVGAVRITATRLAPRTADYIFAIGEVQAWEAESGQNVAADAVVTASDSIEAPPRWQRQNLVDGVYYRELVDAQQRERLAELRERVAAIRVEIETPQQLAQRDEWNSRIQELDHQLAAAGEALQVYAAATQFSSEGQFRSTGGQRRNIPLLTRGDIRKPGRIMEPGMPPLWPGAKEILPSETVDEAMLRRELAQGIASRENPLLWRSIANRLWHWTLGAPLVSTPNDFGRMGAQPTHADLLDYLATRLRDDPHQSLKSIIRLLVTSDAYRRSSQHHDDNALVDAGNQYWWRANRRRLTAEEYRDTLLSLAGCLQIDQRGGPSFRDFVIEKPEHSPHYQYHLHDPQSPDSHRRTIYRFVVRSQPQPFLTSLDCADPAISVAVRDESVTALQALAQWNNVLVESMAARWGDELAQQADPVDWACRQALARSPSSQEKQWLQQHADQHGLASMARVIFNMSALVYLD